MCRLTANPFSLAPCSLGQEPALAKAGDAARRLRRCRRIRGDILDCRCARRSATGQVGTNGASLSIEQRDVAFALSLASPPFHDRFAELDANNTLLLEV